MHRAAELAGKRVVITGASGFLGGALVHSLSCVPCRIVRVARRELAPLAGVAEVCDVQADVREPGLWDRLLAGADVVFPLAAQTSVRVADADPAGDFAVNVRPVCELLEACRRLARPPLIVLAGTETQAGLTAGMVDESWVDCPITVYDLHKLLAEQYLEAYCRCGWARGTGLRFPTLYGQGGECAAPERGMVNRMVRRALAREPLTVWGSGEMLRDYLHVADAVEALLAAAAHGEAVNGRHFLVGTERSCSIAEMMGVIAAETGARVVQVDPPEDMHAIDTRSFACSAAAFRSATGWRAKFSLEAGIADTVRGLQS
jgi:nucleoside-diphosphate-sugar epimerase